MPRWFLVLLGTGLLCCAVGCGGKPQRFAVAGKVTVDGQPAARAKVHFKPLDPPGGKQFVALALAGADGTFRLTALEGVPPGDYAVTVTWPSYRSGGDEEVEGPDRLQGRYNDPSKPVARVTIEDGDNELPTFALRSP